MKRHHVIALMIFSIFTTLYGCVLVYQDHKAEAGHAKAQAMVEMQAGAVH